MPTLNYTTTISATKTAGEIQALLAKHGASAVVVRFDEARLVGISFTFTGPHGERAYALPVDVRAMQKLLDKQWARREIGRRYATPEQAERVAWRVVKDWLTAQFALIEAQMSSLDQIMLPFLHISPDQTMYEAWAENERRALPATD